MKHGKSPAEGGASKTNLNGTSARVAQENRYAVYPVVGPSVYRDEEYYAQSRIYTS